MIGKKEIEEIKEALKKKMVSYLAKLVVVQEQTLMKNINKYNGISKEQDKETEEMVLAMGVCGQTQMAVVILVHQENETTNQKETLTLICVVESKA